MNAKLLLQGPALDAFHKAKKALENFTKLNYRSNEENTVLTLTTDASSNAFCAVL